MKKAANWGAGIYQFLPPLILVAGVAVRVVVLLQNRSLFLDEANLARNIAEKGFFAFFMPLDYQQYAPPLFLVMERINFLVLGSNEIALRTFPLLISILALIVFYLLLSRFFKAAYIRIFLLFMIGFSPILIRYATEIKQYGSDMAVAIVLIYLAIRWFPEKWDWPQAIRWVAVGSFVVWFSMPSVFVLFGLGCYFLWRTFKINKAQVWKVPVICSTWLISFGIYFVLILKTDLGKDYLINYHQAYFFPLFPANSAEWRQFGEILLLFFRPAVGYTFLAYSVGIFFFVLGFWKLFRTDKPILLLLAFPLLSCLLASSLGFYSLMPRLALFLAPLFLLVIGFGMDHLWEKGSSLQRWMLVAATLPIYPLQDGFRYFDRPLQIEEIRPVLDLLRTEENQRGSLLYIHHEAGPAFRYYSELHDRRSSYSFPLVYLAEWDQTPEKAAKEYPESSKMWLVFSHLSSDQARAQMNAILEKAAGLGTFEKRIARPGAEAQLLVLYD